MDQKTIVRALIFVAIAAAALIGWNMYKGRAATPTT